MKYTFKDICTKIGSGATPTGGKEAYKGGDYALVRSQNVLDYTFTTSGLAYINETQAKKLDGVKVEVGDVLLNITGDSVARACIIPDEILPARVNQHVAIIRANNQYALNEYLLYFLQYNKQHLLSISQGGGTRSAITKKMIEDIEINLPSIEDQSAIVNIINSISKKIELNRQINDNLEQQAQAIYKSWFVDFEPFKDQEFVDSEIGLIPENWNCTTLSEFISIKYGKDHKKLADGIIPVFGSGGLMRYVDTKLHEGESVLIPRKGSLNNVMYVNEAFWTVDTMFYSTPKVENSCIYAYLFLANKDLASMNAGSAVPSMTTDILNNMPIIAPPIEVLKQFNNICNVYFSRIHQNNIENANLAKQRDTLLPKLMSGELKINEIDC